MNTKSIDYKIQNLNFRSIICPLSSRTQIMKPIKVINKRERGAIHMALIETMFKMIRINFS